MPHGFEKPFARAFDVVRKALAEHDLDTALRPHLAAARWSEVVGPKLAAVTAVERVIGGDILVVRTKNSVWANELTLLKGDILQRLNGVLGETVLSDIRFQGSGLPATATPARLRPALKTPSAAEIAQVPIDNAIERRISMAVSAVEDDALREKMRRSLLRSAQTDLWKRGHGWRPCSSCGALTAANAGTLLCEFCRLDFDNRR